MKKYGRKIYIGIIMLLLISPAVFLNTKSEQVSKIDNMNLMEWEEVGSADDKTVALDEYIRERIGFRETAIKSYIALNQKVFHYLTDPRRMYGKNGHMFFADKVYIDDYQHLNLEQDKELCKSMVHFLDRTDEFCSSKGIDFIYYLVPDKKTIYEEEFPEFYHVYGDSSRSDYLLSLLEQTDLDYVYPVNELLEGKKDGLVYYKMYDPAHWNADGAFIGQHVLYQHLHNYFAELEMPDKDDYTVSYELKTRTSNIDIDEEIPVYVPKNAGNIKDESEENPLKAHARYFSHFENEDLAQGPKILVFCDSYFYDLEMYYYEQFSEVTFLHNQRNIERIQEFIEYYNPDVVVYETVERVLSVDFNSELLDGVIYQ